MTAVEEFWGETVLAGPFATLEDSELSLAERALRYPGLYDLMPVDLPGKVVLDYGCGPGHDTVLMAGNGAHVYYADISKKALKITGDRLALHGLRGLPLLARDRRREDELWPTVDYIHCAGVLHHTSYPDAILAAFHDDLAPGGEVRLMVYDGDRSEHTQSDVPITHWWGAADVSRMAWEAGFTTEYLGGYDCSAPWRPNCRAAVWRLT